MELRSKLVNELPGILNRALKGLKRLTGQKGFTVPQAVKDELSKYERQNDSLAAFMEEAVDIGPTFSVPKQTFYQRYCRWCDVYRLRRVSKKSSSPGSTSCCRRWMKPGLIPRGSEVVKVHGDGSVCSLSTMDPMRIMASVMPCQTRISEESKNVMPRQTRVPKGHARVRTSVKPYQNRCSQEMQGTFTLYGKQDDLLIINRQNHCIPWTSLYINDLQEKDPCISLVCPLHACVSERKSERGTSGRICAKTYGLSQ